MIGLFDQFMQDDRAKSYVQWLECRVAELEREAAAMEQAAAINHQMWRKANDEAAQMAGLLVTARAALLHGDMESVRRMLEI